MLGTWLNEERRRGRRAPTPQGGRRPLVVEALEARTVPSFLPAVHYDVGMNPRAAAAGDFNGDGIPDIAVVNTESNDVSVLLGSGDGTFQPPRSYATSVNPIDIKVVDFNGDGKLDLVVLTGFGNTLNVLLGNGDGTFQSPLNFPISGTSVAVADLDSDGRPDFVVTSGSGVHVLLSGGGDLTYVTGRGPSYVVVGDFRGDGKLDLAVTNRADATVSVLLGNGDGTFQPAVSYDTGPIPTTVALGDFNGDGIPDLVTANHDTVSVLLGNGDGTFQPPQDYPAGIGGYGVVVGDFNGDGNLDLAVTHMQRTFVSVLLGNGDGTFQPRQNFVADIDGGRSAAIDLNGDGQLDLVVPNGRSNKISVLLNDGNWPSPGRPQTIVWALTDAKPARRHSDPGTAHRATAVQALFADPDLLVQLRTDKATQIPTRLLVLTRSISSGPGLDGLAEAVPTELLPGPLSH